MRKIIVLALLMMITVPVFAATNWSKFESATNNAVVEGYQSQPGYVCFEDGDGNIKGYIYYNATAGELFWVTPDGLALSSGTRIDEGGEIGMPLSEFSGSGLTP